MFAGRFSSSIGLVGIDIGRSGAKMLQVRSSPQSADLDVVGATQIDVCRDGSGAVDRARFAEQLKTGLASGGFSGRRCVVSLPRGDYCLQSVRLPQMPDADLKEAVAWEAAQRFGFERNTIEVDFIRTGASIQGSENREEVLVIAATHEALAAWLDPVLDAGLRPVAVEPDFTAVARTFSRHQRRESDAAHVRAIVDVGESGSTITVVRGRQVAFTKTVDAGGAHFDEALAEHLQMELAAAAELRATRLGGPDTESVALDPATDRAVFDALRPLMGALVQEVVLCLRYYGVTFRGKPPDRLILTGGAGMEPHLAELLSAGCKMPVTHDDELATLGHLIDRIRDKLHRTPWPAASWSAAAGLSLRGIDSGKGARVRVPARKAVGEAA